jgi:hypothetical protein
LFRPAATYLPAMPIAAITRLRLRKFRLVPHWRVPFEAAGA